MRQPHHPTIPTYGPWTCARSILLVYLARILPRNWAVATLMEFTHRRNNLPRQRIRTLRLNAFVPT
jgi:hypothetical protein